MLFMFVLGLLFVYLMLVGTVAVYMWIIGSGLVMMYVAFRIIVYLYDKFAWKYTIIPVGGVVIAICAVLWLLIASSIL